MPRPVSIMLGIPVLDNVHHEFFLRTSVLIGRLAKHGYVVDVCTPNRISIDRARQLIVDNAFFRNSDYILFIDDDTLIPLDTVEVLSEIFQKHPNAVSATGVCYQRGAPWMPMLYKYEDFDWGKGKLHNQLIPPLPEEPFQISCAGMGVSLHRVSHMREIEGDCFSRNGNGTEDFFFFSKVAKKGLEVWCDPRVRAVHLGASVMVTEEYAREEQLKWNKDRVKGVDEALKDLKPMPGQIALFVGHEGGGRGKVLLDEIR